MQIPILILFGPPAFGVILSEKGAAKCALGAISSFGRRRKRGSQLLAPGLKTPAALLVGPQLAAVCKLSCRSSRAAFCSAFVELAAASSAFFFLSLLCAGRKWRVRRQELASRRRGRAKAARSADFRVSPLSRSRALRLLVSLLARVRYRKPEVRLTLSSRVRAARAAWWKALL